MLNFKGETVAEAAAEFNRYDTTKIVVADPSIEDFRIGGAFLATNPESFVAALQKLFAIDAEKRSGSVDLYLSRRKSLASQD
jgi:transmembrane sensor